MPLARVLRVVVFRSEGQAAPVDNLLRDAIVPRLLEVDGVVDAWIGRQGAPDDRFRVLVSTWQAEPDPEPADLAVIRGATGAVSPVVVTVDQLELAVHARFERSEPARVLRIFRGIVRPGELGPYVDEARAGMTADSEVNDGLIAFDLGARPPDEFVTASAWTGWAAIEGATGGNTRQPFATRNRARLASFAIDHYEALPETPSRRPPTSGA